MDPARRAMLLAAVVAGSTAVFLFRRETKHAGAQTSLTQLGLRLRPARTDSVGDAIPEGAPRPAGVNPFPAWVTRERFSLLTRRRDVGVF